MPDSIIFCYLLVAALPTMIWSQTKLSNFMMRLDQNITEILSQPTPEQGEPLLYNLDEYIAHFRDVNHLLKFSPKFMYKTAKHLHEEGAPLFLNVDIDLEHLHNIFKWEDFKTDAINQYIEGIRNYTVTFNEVFPELSGVEFDKYDYESRE
uniref:Uncharacterized protein n=2 Tax=Graphocephala atropunctata TaxID=36148 RepID=A0A1B6KE84_9HEMI